VPTAEFEERIASQTFVLGYSPSYRYVQFQSS